MSITFGKRNTKEIYFGNRKVTKVYFGNQLIWPKNTSVNPKLINNINNNNNNVGPIIKFDTNTTISEITTYFGGNPTWGSGGVKIVKVNTDDWVNNNFDVGTIVDDAESLSMSKTISDSIIVDEVTFYKTTLKLTTDFTFDANDEYVIVMYPAQIYTDLYFQNAIPVWNDRWASSHDGYNSNVIGYMRFDGNYGKYVAPSKITNEYPWLDLK